MNPIVALIWWFTLLGTIFAFLPNLAAWLMRAFGAAREIEKYTADILTAAAGIAENTSKADALKQTLAVAPRLVTISQSIEGYATSLESALAARSSPGPEVPPEETAR